MFLAVTPKPRTRSMRRGFGSRECSLIKNNRMKTNNELIKEIESGNNPFDVLNVEKIESTKNTRHEFKDAIWLGALEANYLNALDEIRRLRKENERVEADNFRLYAESKREDLAQEAELEIKISGEGEE